MQLRLGMTGTFLTVSLLTAAISMTAGPSGAVTDTFHEDHRITPKLDFEPQWVG
ncbi:MAG: hypothetical protein ACI9JE_001175, partial [Candidatus Krumholzibacteriia bacterium]